MFLKGLFHRKDLIHFNVTNLGLFLRASWTVYLSVDGVNDVNFCDGLECVYI